MTGLPEENLDGFTISFRREILFYLRQLINDSEQISVVFNEGRDTILTMLLDVDEEKGLLIFDWGSSTEINRRFLASERNFFIATPLGIRNQFMSGKPWEVSYKKCPAFAVNLPKKYVRLQRRDFFRLTLPITQRPACTFLANNGAPLETSVLDIGLGGVALEAVATGVPCQVGDKIAGAKIIFKDFSELTVNIEVRYVEQTTRGIKKATRLGCQFEHLSPAQEHLLQKYITQVQREERARLGV